MSVPITFNKVAYCTISYWTGLLQLPSGLPSSCEQRTRPLLTYTYRRILTLLPQGAFANERTNNNHAWI
jgi:hypothetical protein